MTDVKNEIDIDSLPPRKQRKHRYRIRMEELLVTYSNCLLCVFDNVGSRQLQAVRIALRGKGVVLMGKNTIMRKVLRDQIEAGNTKLSSLLPCIRGNVGMIFTNDDLAEMRKVIESERVPAAAKTGQFAPVDVYVPPGPTGLDPGQTGFFQALNISTKIARGAIEILNNVWLIHKGERVSSSATALLTKLNIKPFFYGIVVSKVFENGSVYDAKILDMSEGELMSRFFAGVRHVAALSLNLGIPTLASLPHIIANTFKKLVAISLETDYTFEESKVFKDYMANPDAFKSAAPAGGDSKAAEPEPEPEPEEEESEEEADFDLFG